MSNNGGGIGIGLNTALTLAKAVGGNIKIKSVRSKNGNYLTCVGFSAHTKTI